MKILISWLLDLLFGDPQRLPHPIVYMGKWISFGEHHLNKGNHRMFKGALFTLASMAMLFGITWAIFTILDSQADNTALRILSFSLTIILAFFCLAGHTLRKEVRMVFEALNRSLDDGRIQVARIVGRDTQHLTRQEVSAAALETLAENLSDGVIAPLFWYALLGIPGMLTYKLINTFDSMIGYHTPRYKQFGCWAAHIDDIANYIPARITALFIILTGALFHPTQILHYLSFTLRFGNKHASPNSGWPEAALAAILDCRFGGPHDYFGELFHKPYIGTNPRPFTFSDMQVSIRICLIAEILAIAITAIV